MTSEANNCDDSRADYDYFRCEQVEDWHIALSITLFILTIIVSIVVSINSLIIHKYSYFNSIKFRCPRSIWLWGILTNIYLFSRILYAGILFRWWGYSRGLDISIDVIRGLGLNGGILLYIVRAWMYYVTYKYDQDILLDQQSWLFSYKRLKNTISNESWLLRVVIIFLVVLTCLLGIFRFYDIGFSNVYYGISFILSLLILVLVFKFAHDQLGIRYEYATFFTVYIFGAIGFVIITTALEDTTKRMFSWMGSLMLLAAGNAFTFYFPFIRGGLLKVIRNGDGTKAQRLENNKELLLILSSKRTYDAFRTYLASIFCIENLEFFVSVSHYKRALKEDKLKKMEANDALAPAPGHKKGVLSISGIINDKIIASCRALSPPYLDNPVFMNANSDSRNDFETTANDDDDDDVVRTRNSTILIDESIKKVVNSGKNLLDQFKHQKGPNEIINDLVTTKDGRVDPKCLSFEYLEYNEKLKNLPVDEWGKWIYDHYVWKESDSAINIASKTRRSLQKYFEPNDTNEEDEEDKGDSDVIDLKEIFDAAQYEVWRLMVNDSLGHFKQTKQYKQLRSFFQTVDPDYVPKKKSTDVDADESYAD